MRCLLHHGNINELVTASGRERPRGKTDNRKSRSRQVQADLYGAAGDGVVKVPKIYWKYCTKGVLTMEWIEGIKLTDRDALLASGFDIKNLVDQVLPQQCCKCHIYYLYLLKVMTCHIHTVTKFYSTLLILSLFCCILLLHLL